MKPWKTRSKTLVLDCSPWLKVEQHAVELPDGRVIPDWSWVITPDFVNVIAVTDAGRFLLFRQRKYAVRGPMLALVGGILDQGEKPLAAARRELREETGYRSAHWRNLGTYRVDPSRGIAMAHFFLATGCRKVAAPTGGDLEEQELLQVTRRQMEAALDRGEFKILAWAAIVALALRRLEAGRKRRR